MDDGVFFSTAKEMSLSDWFFRSYEPIGQRFSAMTDPLLFQHLKKGMIRLMMLFGVKLKIIPLSQRFVVARWI